MSEASEVRAVGESTKAQTVKVRIDLRAGTLEAEGSEDFVRDLYEDFRDRVVEFAPSPEPSRGRAEAPPPLAAKKTGTERRSGATKSTGVKAQAPVFLKELDLVTKGSRVGLKDFIKRYRKLKGAQEHNGVFVYYLAKIADVKPITVDHVYTCYKDVGAKPPTAFVQSLWDTARKKATIDTSSVQDIKLTMRGENWVEHELPKADTKKTA